MTELFGVLLLVLLVFGCSAWAFVIGWRMASQKGDERRIDLEKLNTEMVQHASDRLGDAERIAKTAEVASNTLLKAAHTERAAADALLTTAESLATHTATLNRQGERLDTLDQNLGAVLTALVAMGAMAQVDTRRRDRQVGEPDPTSPPPSLESLRPQDRDVPISR